MEIKIKYIKRFIETTVPLIIGHGLMIITAMYFLGVWFAIAYVLLAASIDVWMSS